MQFPPENNFGKPVSIINTNNKHTGKKRVHMFDENKITPQISPKSTKSGYRREMEQKKIVLSDDFRIKDAYNNV